jgi:hypothetical protein
MGAEFGRQRPHALFQRLALKGEGQLRAGGMRRPGDAPGDRHLVGDAHDEAALAGQNSIRAGGAALRFRHVRSKNKTRPA